MKSWLLNIRVGILVKWAQERFWTLLIYLKNPIRYTPSIPVNRPHPIKLLKLVNLRGPKITSLKLPLPTAGRCRGAAWYRWKPSQGAMRPRGTAGGVVRGGARRSVALPATRSLWLSMKPQRCDSSPPSGRSRRSSLALVETVASWISFFQASKRFWVGF